MSADKILTLQQMAEITVEARKDGKVIIHCHGVFDLLHIGHIRYFQQARAKGDLLVVTVTPDRFVHKGPGRPAFTEDLRIEAVASLDVVDYVAKNEWAMADETIKLIRPDYYVKGVEYKDAEKDHTGGIVLEKDAVESVGGHLAFTDDIVYSASSLINQNASFYPKEVKEYLSALSLRHKTEDILGYLKDASKLKVLVLGETIIDVYQYCSAIGKSSKEPTLAVKDLYTEKFAGGILAVANHVANFTDDTGLITFLGDRDTEEEFITSKLNPDITSTMLKQTESPTIAKKRIIESYFFTKMLEVYSINDAPLHEEDNKRLCDALEEEVPKYDLVILVDFGHSMMTEDAVKVVSDKAKFLALNVQANAGNMGYNVISKYPRADYVTMAEKEVRLEARDHRSEIEGMMEAVSSKLSCGKVVVTRGSHGSLCYCRTDGFVRVPALARKVVDRVGAGDAFLSVSSLCAVQGAPIEIVGFVGNSVGAWAVETVCNEKSVRRDTLCKQIETMLK